MNNYENYERMQREDEMQQGGGFLLGLLAGAVIGTGLGLLFAPKAGADLRNDLSSSANDFAETASRQYRKASAAATQYAEKGRDMYNTARQAVNRGMRQADRYASEAADEAMDSAAGFTSGMNSGNSGMGAPEGSRS
jgi:gas vesicle protein